MLLCFLLVPLLVWLRYFLRRRPTAAFSRGEALRALPKSWAIRMQPLLPVLYGIGLICSVVAMARPQKGLSQSRVRTEAVDIVLLTDVSGSMGEQDFVKDHRRISRMDASKSVIAEFMKSRKDDRIGMVAFAAMPYSLAPLTLDHGWLTQRLELLQAGMLDQEIARTAIGDGIASAVNRLRDSEAKSRIIILLTDGESNYGELSPENAAEAAKALGIKIYTIGIGGAPMNHGIFGARSRTNIDEPMLTNIATTTEGVYFRALTMESLEEVYAEIDQLEKTEIDVEQFTRFEEKAGGWIIAALACLMLERLLTLTRLGRLPS
jgi:Ca-activated chloride channel family protein